jgi:hypothetical protein
MSVESLGPGTFYSTVFFAPRQGAALGGRATEFWKKESRAVDPSLPTPPLPPPLHFKILSRPPDPKQQHAHTLNTCRKIRTQALQSWWISEKGIGTTKTVGNEKLLHFVIQVKLLDF